jgi:type II secretory pathway pseudopilin PulG
MSTITLSSNLQNAIVSNLFESGSSPSITGGTIKMMKGTVPTDFSGLTNASSRSADVLWSDTISSGEGILANGVWTLSTAYQFATQSGTATWYWLSNWGGNGGSQIVGTIGTTGSGADLTLDSTTILSGAWYRVYNLKFTIPTTYTY